MRGRLLPERSWQRELPARQQGRHLAEALERVEVDRARAVDGLEIDRHIRVAAVLDAVRVPARPDEVEVLRERQQVAPRCSGEAGGDVHEGLGLDVQDDVLGLSNDRAAGDVLLDLQEELPVGGGHVEGVDVPVVEHEVLGALSAGGSGRERGHRDDAGGEGGGHRRGPRTPSTNRVGSRLLDSGRGRGVMRATCALRVGGQWESHEAPQVLVGWEMSDAQSE